MALLLSERTVRAYLRRSGLTRAALTAEPAKAFGRYEASGPNEIWIGDVLVGPFVPHPRVAGSKRAGAVRAGRRLQPVAGARPVDDRGEHLLARTCCARPSPAGACPRSCTSTTVPPTPTISWPGPARCSASPSCTPSLTRRKAAASRSDSTSTSVNRSSPRWKTVGHRGLRRLNDLFMAWAEQVANARTPRRSPNGRRSNWSLGANDTLTRPHPAVLAEARWSMVRRVTKTATISLQANRYQVDPCWSGGPSSCSFDPEDLTRIDVFDRGVGAGVAIPFVIGRHVHPAVPQAAPPRPVDPEPGIDYMGLVAAAHVETLGEGSISYRDVRLPVSRISSTSPSTNAAATATTTIRSTTTGWRADGRRRRGRTSGSPALRSPKRGLANKLFDRAAHGRGGGPHPLLHQRERAFQVVGDTGSGKTAAARCGRLLGPHQVHRRVPVQPVRGCRGPGRHRHRARRDTLVPQGRSHQPGRRPARRRRTRTSQSCVRDRRSPSSIARTARGDQIALERGPRLGVPVRGDPDRPADPGRPPPARHLRRPRSASASATLSGGWT